MRVAIVGSRDWKREDDVIRCIFNLPDDTVIISGGARGVDSMAEKWAKFRGLKVQIFQPNWGKYGKQAGMIRNSEIVANCDRLIAFHCNNSKGTQNSIDKARKAGKPVEIIED